VTRRRLFQHLGDRELRCKIDKKVAAAYRAATCRRPDRSPEGGGTVERTRNGAMQCEETAGCGVGLRR
jgi:hypothetical protein